MISICVIRDGPSSTSFHLVIYVLVLISLTDFAQVMHLQNGIKYGIKSTKISLTFLVIKYFFAHADSGQVRWEFVHGLFANAIYGGRVDNTFDLKVLESYLLQYFDQSSFPGQVCWYYIMILHILVVFLLSRREG